MTTTSHMAMTSQGLMTAADQAVRHRQLSWYCPWFQLSWHCHGMRHQGSKALQFCQHKQRGVGAGRGCPGFVRALFRALCPCFTAEVLCILHTVCGRVCQPLVGSRCLCGLEVWSVMVSTSHLPCCSVPPALSTSHYCACPGCMHCCLAGPLSGTRSHSGAACMAHQLQQHC